MGTGESKPRGCGIDEESIQDFERQLKDNLYRIWNRMSSGSYLPPPVRTVAIPKAGGGERKLGIPTVADRVAQMVVKRQLEPKLEPLFHPTATGIGPSNPPTRRWAKPDKDAGGMTGFWIWTSKASSTTSPTT